MKIDAWQYIEQAESARDHYKRQREVDPDRESELVEILEVATLEGLSKADGREADDPLAYVMRCVWNALKTAMGNYARRPNEDHEHDVARSTDHTCEDKLEAVDTADATENAITALPELCETETEREAIEAAAELSRNGDAVPSLADIAAATGRSKSSIGRAMQSVRDRFESRRKVPKPAAMQVRTIPSEVDNDPPADFRPLSPEVIAAGRKAIMEHSVVVHRFHVSLEWFHEFVLKRYGYELLYVPETTIEVDGYLAEMNDAWRRRAEALRAGAKERDVGLILNVAALDGAIPFGTYILVAVLPQPDRCRRPMEIISSQNSHSFRVQGTDGTIFSRLDDAFWNRAKKSGTI